MTTRNKCITSVICLLTILSMATVIIVIIWNTTVKPSEIKGNKDVIQKNNFLDIETTYNSNGKIENSLSHTICWLGEVILSLTLTIVVTSFVITKTRKCLMIKRNKKKK